MRVIVCGGRNYTDRARVFRLLDTLHGREPISAVIHGAAPGADPLAGEWAKARGIAVDTYPADWTKYGRAAGPIRNSQMLRESRPDIVVAFPGKRGTADMVAKALSAGVRVVEVPAR